MCSVSPAHSKVVSDLVQKHVASKLQEINYRKLLTSEVSLMEMTQWCLDSVTCALSSESCTGHLPELCRYMILAIQAESYLLSCSVWGVP